MADSASKKKKKTKAGKVFGLICSGLLFGFCAGFVIVLMIRLMPDQKEADIQTEGNRQSQTGFYPFSAMDEGRSGIRSEAERFLSENQ